jgi:hypothetical protein
MYIKVTQTHSVYPYNIAAFRQEHARTSFPANYETDFLLLASFGVYPVMPTPCPAYDSCTHDVRELDPALIDDKYVQQWQVIELNEQERQEKINAARRELEALVQEQLNAFAMQKGYNGIESAVSYVYSKVAKFAEEARYAVDMRDAMWAKLYEIFDQVNQGQRAMPRSLAEIESELPTLTWDTAE